MRIRFSGGSIDLPQLWSVAVAGEKVCECELGVGVWIGGFEGFGMKVGVRAQISTGSPRLLERHGIRREVLRVR